MAKKKTLRPDVAKIQKKFKPYVKILRFLKKEKIIKSFSKNQDVFLKNSFSINFKNKPLRINLNIFEVQEDYVLILGDKSEIHIDILLGKDVLISVLYNFVRSEFLRRIFFARVKEDLQETGLFEIEDFISQGAPHIHFLLKFKDTEKYGERIISVPLSVVLSKEEEENHMKEHQNIPSIFYYPEYDSVLLFKAFFEILISFDTEGEILHI